MMGKTGAIAAFSLLVAGLWGSAPAHRGGGRSTNWASIGGNPANSHYSPLTQINRSNVRRLTQVWTFDTGQEGGLETTPIVLDGGLYSVTSQQPVLASNTKPGTRRWKFA